MASHQFYECEKQSCRFRFPVIDEPKAVRHCPFCGAATGEAAQTSSGGERRRPLPAPGNAVEALLDNIRSVYNVGSMFRSADGAAIQRLHLGGITATPDHPRVGKTALGAELAIPWTQVRNGVDAAVSLRASGFRLWAIEDSPQAQSLFEVVANPPLSPIMLVVGNELAGIDPDILTQCERVLWIPMHGQKQSLNVAVAFGVAAYFLRYACLTMSPVGR